MPDGTTVGRVTRIALVLMAVSAVLSVRAAEQPAPTPDAALARDVEARFDVVVLAHGLALSHNVRDRRIEISGGRVLSGGAVVSDAEVQQRFGRDADLIRRLAALDDASLRRLFAPDTAPAPTTPVPAAPPAAPVPNAAGTSPAIVPDQPEPADVPTSRASTRRRTGARLSLGRDVVVAADEAVTDGVVSLGGDVRIDGAVRDDVVVLGGDLVLSPGASVDGDLTVVGGTLTIAEGARHRGAVHHTVGPTWPRLAWPSIGWSRFEPVGAGRWLPLAGTATRLVLLALAVALASLLAHGRVTRIAGAATAQPLRSAVVGFGMQVLFVPALVILAVLMAVTLVGIPFIVVVIPLAVVAMGATMILGFAGVARTVGGWASRDGSADGRVAWMAIVGLGLIVLPTLLARLVGVSAEAMRPLATLLLAVGAAVEYVAWTIGLGAAVTTGLGRWAVVPPPVPPSSFGTPSVAEPSGVL